MLNYIVFICLVLKINGFTPNCEKQNQFKFYEFEVEGCSEMLSEKCQISNAAFLKSLGPISLVKIGRTEIVPTCAFHDIVGLKYIQGVNSDIKVVADGAFANLAELNSINLAFNSIREVRKVIFRNVSVNIINMSWNKLLYIDSHAFSEIRGLKHLDVSYNFLQTLDITFLPKSIRSVNASHNLLTKFAVYTGYYDNLTIVDWSSNLLENVAIFLTNPAELIDLTNNQLSTLDYVSMSHSIDILKIAQNQFEEVPQYMKNINAKYMTILPNPWKCNELRRLWKILYSLNTKVIPEAPSNYFQPLCGPDKTSFYTAEPNIQFCTDDHECPDNMLCNANSCRDPCQYSLCHPSSNCKTTNHKMDCTCQKGFLQDPMELTGKCRKVECFASKHCAIDEVCFQQKCSPLVSVSYGYSGGTPIEPPWWYSYMPIKEIIPNTEILYSLGQIS